MSIQYKLKKLLVRINKTKQKDLDLDDIQDPAYSLIVDMINDKSNNLLFDPSAGRRGIEQGDVFIIIQKNKLIFVNGVFNNHIPIDDRIHASLVDKFDAKISRRFNAIESKARERTKNNIDSIRKSINKPDNT